MTSSTNSRDLRAEWAARPPTVRAWVVLTVAFFLVELAIPGGGRPALVSVLINAALLWGIWVGNQLVWLLLLVSTGLSLVMIVTRFNDLPLWAAGIVAASLALLIAPSTQEWVRLRTRERAEAAQGPQAPSEG